MRNLYKSSLMLLASLMLVGNVVLAQNGVIDNMRSNDKDGLNVFEPAKDLDAKFDGVKVRIGGDFALQFQGLDQSNAEDSLVQLGNNLNLPTANLNIDVQLYDGVRMHLTSYLSARHHEESWVKGGYVKFDKLDFIKEGLFENIMQYTYIKVGLDEINYGDAHFRRTDNAKAIYNPFVGNYLMDAFTTEAFGEVVVQTDKGFIGVLGVSNGKLNQNVTVTSATDNKLSFYGKVGVDRQLNDDLRMRLTGSWYTNQGSSTGSYLYGGDRGGSRYYYVLHDLTDGGTDFEGRFNPRFTQNTSFQINPFIKYKGLEFFGIYEVSSNSEEEANGSYTQLAGELLYRFGGQEQFYLGGRYNAVSGEDVENGATKEVNRVNIGGGWFLTKNIVTKFEYVNQQYEGEGWTGTKYEGAEFKGVMIEAAISF
ncbi:hypothetical protein [Chondrinema litorale]|uniref:hypothetical protein n=1 Tax=Chondrinema litorale TaxID=2994555 RepID=UPI00254341B4|nr:hypothetical protein [Chondrinema litorale]UZR94508.1 hypothetical protein OQ292_01575 [Chondrinema litorale]